MDIALAGELDGIGAAEAIRRYLDSPIIFTSGYNTDDVRNRALAVSGSVFLGKPVELDSLRAALQDVKLG
jgi:CheY-like chemotaxis protein